MKKLLLILLLSSPLFSISQDIVTNHTLIEMYVNEYIEFHDEDDINVRFLINERVKYIVISNDGIEIPNLGKTIIETGVIILSNKVLIDSMILKIILFRELSYTLGVNYDTSLIMNLKQDEGFTYSVFNDTDVFDVEMSSLLLNSDVKPNNICIKQ